jgi:glyoxylase-like metal-dependent hydrolase (beta-lactamase superfamily II)
MFKNLYRRRDRAGWRRHGALIVAVFVFALATPPSAVAADDVLPQPVEVSEHAWAWIGPYGPPTAGNRGFRMNLGLVVGNESAAVIDSGYGDAMAEAMLEQIAVLTDRPVRYVINTNSQPHRILGNAVFRDAGAQIIAAADAVPRIRDQGPDLAATAAGILEVPVEQVRAPGTPDVVIESETEIDLGGVTLRVVPVGTAHTPGSLVVEVVGDDLVFAGDVLYGGRLLSVLAVSRTDGWIEAIDRLRAFGEVRFVPGHGQPGPFSAFEQANDGYLRSLKAHMDTAVDDGLGLQESIDSFDQSAWSSLADFELLAGRNAHRVYLEREAAAFE